MTSASAAGTPANASTVADAAAKRRDVGRKAPAPKACGRANLTLRRHSNQLILGSGAGEVRSRAGEAPDDPLWARSAHLRGRSYGLREADYGDVMPLPAVLAPTNRHNREAPSARCGFRLRPQVAF